MTLFYLCMMICQQAHWTKLLFVQTTLCSKGAPPTSIKPEATLGEQLDSRISSQPDIPHAYNEKAEKSYSEFDKTSLDFSNKSMQIANLF